MRNLHGELGIPSTAEDTEVLRACDTAPPHIASVCRQILLIPERRKAYDHAMRAMISAALVRSELGLTQTPLWSFSDQNEWSIDGADEERDPQSFRKSAAHRYDEEQRYRRFKNIVLSVTLTLLIYAMFTCSRNDRPSSTYIQDVTTTTSGDNYQPEEPVYTTPQHSANRPRHGKIFVRAKNPISRLDVKGDGDTVGPDHFFKLVDARRKRTVCSFYVRAGKSLTVPIPLGEFLLYENVGYEWINAKKGFGPGTLFQKYDDHLHVAIDEARGAVNYYSITIYQVRDGNATTSTVDPNDFELDSL